MKANYTTSDDNNVSVISTGTLLWINIGNIIYVVNNPDGPYGNRSIVINDDYTPNQAFQKMRIWEQRLKNQKRPFDFDDSHPQYITLGNIRFPKKTWVEWRDTMIRLDKDGELKRFEFWLFTHPHIPGDGLIITEPDFEKACKEAKKWFDNRHPA